jgi:serine/threonine protein kinase
MSGGHTPNPPSDDRQHPDRYLKVLPIRRDWTPAPDIRFLPEWPLSLISGVSFHQGSDKEMAISMPYFPRGSLQAHLGSRLLNPTVKLNIIFGIVKAVDYLHSKKWAHGNIKPSNVLLTDKFEPALSDLFFNDFLPIPGPDEPLLTPSGQPSASALSVLYRAPELQSGGPYTQAGDIYSFGVLMYELFAHEPLILSLDMKRRIQPKTIGEFIPLVQQGIRYRFFPKIPCFYWDLICRCWADDPTERPQFSAILTELTNSDSFLRKGDLNAISAYRQMIHRPDLGRQPAEN